MAIKKIAIFFGNQRKVAIYTGYQKIIYCPTFTAFLAIFEGSSRKKNLMSNQFLSWLYNADSELYYFLLKSMQQPSEKKLVLCFFYYSFQVALAFILKRKKYNSESTLFYQLLKLILEYAISFLPGPLKIVKNALNIGQSTLFKVYEKPKQSENHFFQATKAWI